ncbi:hypothetical protein [Ferrimicrobium sp.]|uniref:hypothetical protein n=1 Tax=Ferrimicrobium sp. TaxID=2926050 RepID=UPI0026210800|nr:hypothetical protein [Ferrimicrobium sp.]
MARTTKVTMLVDRAGDPGDPCLCPTHVLNRRAARLLSTVGALGCRRAGEPRKLSRPDAVSLAQYLFIKGITLLGICDSAALLHAVAPQQTPIEARLAFGMGCLCLRRLSSTLGHLVNEDPSPTDPIALTRGIDRLAAVRLPMERSRDDTWVHFRAWR